MTANATTLMEVAKANWRALAPVWVFPLFFLLGGAAAHALGYLNLFFWFVAIPVFFWSFYRALAACRRAKVRYWHAAFWVVLVPLAISGIAVYSRLLALQLMGSDHAV